MTTISSQVFTIDPKSVQKAPQVRLTAIDLFFRSKPAAIMNRTGIKYPRAVVRIVPSRNGVPDVSGLTTAPAAVLPYTKIPISYNGSLPAKFVFPEPVVCRSGHEYAMIVSFDGNEDYVLWKSKKGAGLVGSNAPSPGPSGDFVGAYYENVSKRPVSTWRKLEAVDLKFNVYVARFAFGGNTDLSAKTGVIEPIGVDSSGDGWVYQVPPNRREYISYDYTVSRAQDFRLGERVWQKAPVWPNEKSPATISVIKGSKSLTASADLSSLYSAGSASDQYIVVVSGTRHMIRRVVSVSGRVVTVDSRLPFTNASCQFYRPAAGVLKGIEKTKLNGKRGDIAYVTDSNANSSVRFANDVIESITVTVGGTGYSNTDRITVTGYEAQSGIVIGGRAANALITTNSSGGIVSVHMADPGRGFVNAAAITATVSNSTGGATGGSGAAFSFDVGMTIASEFRYNTTTGYLGGCKVINQPVNDVRLVSRVTGAVGAQVTSKLVLPYYRLPAPDLAGGWRYHIDSMSAENDSIELHSGQIVVPDLTKSRVLPSWSNEQVITYAESGASSNGTGLPSGSIAGNSVPGSSNSAVLTYDVSSKNDFLVPWIPRSSIMVYSKYEVNNDDTREETNQGNAASRGIEKKISFADGVVAEDIRVLCRAFRPASTDLQVFVKIHNEHDGEPFDDKEWTRLILTGAHRYSSRTDPNDLVTLEYGFRQWPSAVSVPGTVTTDLANTTVTGTNLSSLSAGDLVRIYNPLFQTTNYEVHMVSSVTNSTSIDLVDPVSNAGIAGASMRIERIVNPGQAFNYAPNQNVVRYYAESGGVFDGFNTFQVKIVPLADSDALVPKVEWIQAIGVSA